MLAFYKKPCGKLSLMLSSLLLVACGDSTDESSNTISSIDSNQKHTVLVYMVGSDLESQYGSATADINEMLKVGSTKNLNIILSTGGSNKEGWKTVKRFRIPEGTKNITTINELTPITDLGTSVNMGDASTLQNFLDWGIKNYPADTYSVIFWDHGGGAVGGKGTVGNDENHEGDGLSLKEINDAFKAVTALHKTNFELIGFDTCLMATLETATIASAYANYMVASEEVEPSAGWDYTSWLGAIKNKPTISTIELSKVIIDSYYNTFTNNPEDQKITTLSAIQLNKVANLNKAVDKLALKLGNNLNAAPDSVRIEIGTGREKSESYGKQHNTDSGMVDLADFSTKLPVSYTTEANNVRTALAEAVFYHRKGSSRPQASGLSIYLPDSKTISSTQARLAAIQTYKEIGFLNSWTQFVDSYANKVFADTTPPVISNVSFVNKTLKATVMGNGKDVEKVEVLITANLANGGQLVVAKEDVDDYVNNQAEYLFENFAILLNGTSVFIEDIESYDDGSGLAGIPAVLNGQAVTIYVEYEVQDKSFFYKILGALPKSFDGAVARLVPINIGDSINPLYEIINADGSRKLVVVSSNNFIVNKTNLKLTIGGLEAGSYNLYLQATDFSGNTSMTKNPIVIKVN